MWAVGRATFDAARFHNLAWSYLVTEAIDRAGNPRQVDGSPYFNADGNIFDQILVNRSLLNGERGVTVLEGTAHIATPAPMVSRRVSEGPIRFGLPRGNPETNVNQDRYSDHFPVAVTLDEP